MIDKRAYGFQKIHGGSATEGAALINEADLQSGVGETMRFAWRKQDERPASIFPFRRENRTVP